MLSDSRRKAYEAAFEFASRQVGMLIEKHPDFFPMYTLHGKWDHGGEAWTNWCEGFLGGELWLLYLHTRDTYWLEKAGVYCRKIEPRQNDRTVHDLGFLFWPTWKRWYDFTGDPAKKQVVITAGATMGYRYKDRGSYLRSFVADDSLFIDIMMNVGIVFYAAQKGGDDALYNIAMRHCLTTRRTLVRGDGSTAHEGLFDLETGEFLRQSTQQGYRSDSAWARGQAWAIYGFGTAYEMTGDPRFLATAEACAAFYIDSTLPNGIPPNDWDDPHPVTPYESSAAAITASGLLNLATLTTDPLHSRLYRDYALTILDSLSGPEFLATGDENWEGILKHASYHERKGLGVDESVMWGDYYYLEALNKALHG